MIHTALIAKLNLLAVSYSQHVTVAELEQFRPQIEAMLNQLPPGFQLLADLTGLDTMDYDCATEIAKAMDLCHAHGVRKVVRVVPDPRKDIGLRVMSYFHYGHNVPVITCETVAEALDHLAP
jgi:anti-anti-sigma regulatory factor